MKLSTLIPLIKDTRIWVYSVNADDRLSFGGGYLDTLSQPEQEHLSACDVLEIYTMIFDGGIGVKLREV